MSRFRMIVVGAIAAAGLAIGGGPAIAAVAQAHVAHHQATSRVVMIPDSHCPRGGNEVTIYKANCTDATALNHGSCNATSGQMPFSPQYIFNGCSTRVWLFTQDLSGTKVCITAFTGNDGPFGPSYHYYQITTNPHPCP